MVIQNSFIKKQVRTTIQTYITISFHKLTNVNEEFFLSYNRLVKILRLNQVNLNLLNLDTQLMRIINPHLT